MVGTVCDWPIIMPMSLYLVWRKCNVKAVVFEIHFRPLHDIDLFSPVAIKQPASLNYWRFEKSPMYLAVKSDADCKARTLTQLMSTNCAGIRTVSTTQNFVTWYSRRFQMRSKFLRTLEIQRLRKTYPKLTYWVLC